MSQNVTSTELSVKQERFIASLLAGNNILVSAKAANVANKTAHAWLKLPHVKAAYREAKREVFEESLSTLTQDIDTAIRGIKLLALDKEVAPSVRLRAYQIWLEQSINLYKTDQAEELLAELLASKERAA